MLGIALIARNRKRLENLLPEYQETILGATVLAAAAWANFRDITKQFIEKHLSKVVGFEMKQAKFAEEVIEDSALFDGSQNNDSFIYLDGCLEGYRMCRRPHRQ